MMDVLYGAVTAVMHLVVIAVLVSPFAWWSARKRGERLFTRAALRPALLAFVLFVGYSAVLRLPRIGPFADLEWNWQNKILGLVILIVFALAVPSLQRRAIGLKLPMRGWWIPILAMIASLAGLQLLIGPLSPMSATAESLAFQSIVPGLDEELLFRGILLLLLDQALRSAPREVPTAKHSVRWSAVAISVLFGLAHGLSFTDGFGLLFDPASIVVTGLLGALLMWIRIRWDSLLPAVIAHNVINSSIVIANMVAAS